KFALQNAQPVELVKKIGGRANGVRKRFLRPRRDNTIDLLVGGLEFEVVKIVERIVDCRLRAASDRAEQHEKHPHSLHELLYPTLSSAFSNNCDLNCREIAN